MSKEIIAAIKILADGLAEHMREQARIAKMLEIYVGGRSGEPTGTAGVDPMAHQHDRVERVAAEADKALGIGNIPNLVRWPRCYWLDGQWIEFDQNEVRYGEHKAAKTGPVSEAITVVGAMTGEDEGPSTLDELFDRLAGRKIKREAIRAGSVDHKAINEAHVERELAGPWLDTNGITRPCRGGDVVRVRFRNGSTAEGLAQDFSWLHGIPQPDDIVGWQLLREKAAS